MQENNFTFRENSEWHLPMREFRGSLDLAGEEGNTPRFRVGSFFSISDMIQFRYELTILIFLSWRLLPWPDSCVRKCLILARLHSWTFEQEWFADAISYTSIPKPEETTSTERVGSKISSNVSRRISGLTSSRSQYSQTISIYSHVATRCC